MKETRFGLRTIFNQRGNIKVGQSVCNRCRNRPRPQSQIEEYVQSREKLQGKEAEEVATHRERDRTVCNSPVPPSSGFCARRVILRDVTMNAIGIFRVGPRAKMGLRSIPENGMHLFREIFAKNRKIYR